MATYTSEENSWRFESREHHFERIEPLLLQWEVRGDPIGGSYTPEEISAHDLFLIWLRNVGGEPVVPIYWSVLDVGEAAPLQLPPHDYANFSTYWTDPVNTVTAEPLNWVRLPVADKEWSAESWDSGGFIQQCTGWKPSALQPTVNVGVLRAAADATPKGR